MDQREKDIRAYRPCKPGQRRLYHAETWADGAAYGRKDERERVLQLLRERMDGFYTRSEDPLDVLASIVVAIEREEHIK